MRQVDENMRQKESAGKMNPNDQCFPVNAVTASL